MTMGDLIEKYCAEHGMSKRQFATYSGLTSGYITMLVKGENPRTKKPLRPTIDTYSKVASALGISASELFKLIDDVPIAFNVPDTAIVFDSLTADERYLLSVYRAAEPIARQYAIDLLESHRAEKKENLA